MGSDSHHVVPMKTYLNIFGALIILTILTVAVAKPVSGFDAGIFNAFIAMAIASAKAFLVAGWFMHLKYDNKLYLGILAIAIFFMIILLAFTGVDIVSRVPESSTL